MLNEHDNFLTLLLDGDRRRAEEYARRVFERHGVRFLYEEVVQPALQEIGNLWSANRITIAGEHLATATAQCAVAALYPLFPWPSRGPRVLVACAEGERHEFGARMVADLLALDGWDERFLGADVPVEALVREVQRLSPKLVALSITVPFHLPMARSAIDLLRASSPGVKILVGGRATADRRDVAETLGADAVGRSGSEAVEVARGWK